MVLSLSSNLGSTSQVKKEFEEILESQGKVVLEELGPEFTAFVAQHHYPHYQTKYFSTNFLTRLLEHVRDQIRTRPIDLVELASEQGVPIDYLVQYLKTDFESLNDYFLPGHQGLLFDPRYVTAQTEQWIQHLNGLTVKTGLSQVIELLGIHPVLAERILL